MTLKYKTRYYKHFPSLKKMSLLNMIPKLDPDDVFTVCPPATSKMISQKLTINAINIFQQKDM